MDVSDQPSRIAGVGDDVRSTSANDSPSDRADNVTGASPFGGRVAWGKPQYQPLVAVMLAAAVGLILDRHGVPTILGSHLPTVVEHATAVQFAVWWISAASTLLAWWLAWRRHREGMAMWLLLAAVALTGAAWHHLCWSVFPIDEIGRFAVEHTARPTCVEVLAREAPERLSAPRATPLRAIPGVERSRLLVAVTAIRDGVRWRRATGDCQLTVDGHLLGVRCGDRLQVYGQLVGPQPPLNPGEFDFAAHARADRQLAQLRCSSPDGVSVRSRGSHWTVSSLLDGLRLSSKRLLREFVGPEHDGLAAAILLGAREGLPYDETEPYLVTGTIHVLVVSGMNVAILAAGLLPFLRLGYVSRRMGLALIIVAVVVYALLTKGQPPAVRAAVFGVLVCLAAWTGRRGQAFNSLAASALCVLAINPADLFRVGPQLSFLAVAALVFVGGLNSTFGGRPIDPLQRLLTATRPWYWQAARAVLLGVGWLLLTSVAVWLVTLPLVLMNFHVASPISVLISPLVWPLVFAAMWAGFVMLVLGWFVPTIGDVCGAICSSSLSGLESVVAWAEQIPSGHLWLPGPAWWWVAGYHLGLIAVFVRSRWLPPLRWQIAALCAWMLAGLVPPLVRPIVRDGLTCSFAAVGHGTCVVMETPTGETLLYDAGALGSPESATRTIASYLWQHGIIRIDGIVISHADVDHYNAVPGLLERFTVGAIYVSPVMFENVLESNEHGGRELLRAAIQNHSVPLREIRAGDTLRVGPKLQISVLHPPARGVLGSNNANSVTLTLEYDSRRLLLPGDLESPGIDDLMAELPYDCDILLAPHHGSRQSDPPGFAAWSTPDWVIISGDGAAEVFPVVRAYQAVGAAVLHTQSRGAIEMTLGAKSIGVSTFLGGRL